MTAAPIDDEDWEGLGMAEDQPRTGDGRTRGRKLGSLNVNVQRQDGSVNWKQTSNLFKGETPRVTPAPRPQQEPQGKWVRHFGFGSVFKKRK
jgi:hypothetical protein